jgi:toxin HigB-1
VDIDFGPSWLEKAANSEKYARRKMGDQQAALFKQALDDLDAADTLEIVRPLRHLRCHELGAPRKGQLAVDLDHPYRLIFIPANEPTPRKEDGGLDWTRVTRIKIMEIVDYH